MPNTPILNLPYPDEDDLVDVPRDIGALATAVDTLSYVPVGAVAMWLTANPPAGWLLLDGRQVSAGTYPGLAQMFGQSGGNVTLPDLRDRMPIGASATRALLSTGGEAQTLLTANQSGMRSHTHGNTFATTAASHVTGGYPWALIANGSVVTGKRSGTGSESFPVGAGGGGTASIFTYNSGAHSHSITGGIAAVAAQNASEAHNNLPPFTAVNFIIRAG